MQASSLSLWSFNYDCENKLRRILSELSVSKTLCVSTFLALGSCAGNTYSVEIKSLLNKLLVSC